MDVEGKVSDSCSSNPVGAQGRVKDGKGACPTEDCC